MDCFADWAADLDQDDDPTLRKLLQAAHAGERAAARAYRGHAAFIADRSRKSAIARIEHDEWQHRAVVGRMLARRGWRPSRLREIRFGLIGIVIALACALIGTWLADYYAGLLEASNVAEYEELARLLEERRVPAWEIAAAHHMARVEAEHEAVFATAIGQGPWARRLATQHRWPAALVEPPKARPTRRATRVIWQTRTMSATPT
jgi:demethoxyubiquinone hydroxylase (CLK1/Coq7/Cat5 family)